MRIEFFTSRRQRQWIAWLTVLLLAVGMFGRKNVLLATFIQNYYFVRWLEQSNGSPNATEVADQVGAFASQYISHAGINRLAGRYYQSVHLWSAANRYWQQAASLTPWDSNTLFWLAKSYEALGDYRNTLRYMYHAGQPMYFPAAIEELPENELLQLVHQTDNDVLSGTTRSRLAVLLYPINQVLAQQQFELAIQHEPQSVDNVMNAAWFYYQQHDFEQAKTFGELATTRFQYNATVQLFWGAFFKGTGNLAQAEAAFAKAVQFAQSQGIANAAEIGLADILIETGQYEEALERLNVATATQLDQFSVSLIQSQANAALGKCILAWTKLDKAALMSKSVSQDNAFTRRYEWVEERCPR